MKKKIIMVSVLIVLVLSFAGLFNKSDYQYNTLKKYVNDNSEENFDSLKVIYFLNFQDFSCPSCYNDFLGITKLIQESGLFTKRAVGYFIKKDYRELQIQKRIVNRIFKNLKINDRYSVVNEFYEIFFMKSGLVIINGKKIFCFSFPFGSDTNMVLAKLKII